MAEFIFTVPDPLTVKAGLNGDDDDSDKTPDPDTLHLPCVVSAANAAFALTTALPDTCTEPPPERDEPVCRSKVPAVKATVESAAASAMPAEDDSVPPPPSESVAELLTLTLALPDTSTAAEKVAEVLTVSKPAVSEAGVGTLTRKTDNSPPATLS